MKRAMPQNRYGVPGADEPVTSKGKTKTKSDETLPEPVVALGLDVDEPPTVASIMSDPELIAIPAKLPSASRVVISDEPIAVESAAVPSGPKLSKRTLAEMEAGRESLKGY